MSGIGETRWLLLIHQIPPKPDYLRVKIWRRLQKLGAVAIKNSVYVLPNTDQAHEDFQWVLREILAGGGVAMVCEARMIEGLSDEQVIALFRTARAADYAQIAGEGRKLAKRISGSRVAGERRTEVAAELGRSKRRLAEVVAIDFFGAPGRQNAKDAIGTLETSVRSPRPGSRPAAAKAPPNQIQAYRGRTWVTRKGIHVDRMASAWLIRRFIDPEARFKFVSAKGYRPQAGEVRFDMFEAEFTHEGDRCTFEVLNERFGLADVALRPIAEIIHDIDLKDSKFGRQEVAGISRLIAGIALAHKDDEERLPRGGAVFEGLYEYFRRYRDDSTLGPSTQP